MNTKLLREFAAWLEDNIKPNQFDFSRVVSNFDEDKQCVTVCCAIGWLPNFNQPLNEEPKTKHRVWLVKDQTSQNANLVINDDEQMYYRVAEQYFGIPSKQASVLFKPFDETFNGYSPEEFANECDDFEQIEMITEERIIIDGFPYCSREADASDLKWAIDYYIDSYESNGVHPDPVMDWCP